MARFPVDDVTLELLAASCRMNPDTGQTHLMDFLAMGERIKSEALIDQDGPGGHPIYMVEHEPGYEPFTPHEVIEALVEEIQRLRDELIVT
jgi:hypothetical protein